MDRESEGIKNRDGWKKGERIRREGKGREASLTYPLFTKS